MQGVEFIVRDSQEANFAVIRGSVTLIFMWPFIKSEVIQPLKSRGSLERTTTRSDRPLIGKWNRRNTDIKGDKMNQADEEKFKRAAMQIMEHDLSIAELQYELKKLQGEVERHIVRLNNTILMLLAGVVGFIVVTLWMSGV